MLRRTGQMITTPNYMSPGSVLPPPQIGYLRWARIFGGFIAIWLIMGAPGRVQAQQRPPDINDILRTGRKATEQSKLSPTRTKAPQPRKNVLFIAVDDLRVQLGCYGDSAAITPNIDRIATSGTVFRQAYAQQAVCNPSRASLMTGLRPDTTKVWDLETHFRQALPDVVTLPQYFKQHGYHSLAIGKIYHDPEWAQDAQSWSEPGRLTITRGDGKYALPESRPKKGKSKGVATERAHVPDNAYIDGQVSDEAVKVLQAVKDRPFFLAVGFRRPHLPFSAPEKYWAMYDNADLPITTSSVAPDGIPPVALHNWTELRGYADMPKDGPLPAAKAKHLVHGYYASISYVDAQIGRLLDELERLELNDDTIIVLWSDHGYHLGEKGLWCKTTNFELDTRVPLIFADPEQKVKGTSSTAIVELVDVYPTLVEAAGLPKKDGLEGGSFSWLLNSTLPGKGVAYSQFPRPMPSKGRKAEVMGRSVRNGTVRYTEWQDVDTGEVVAREFYDHRTDPDELVNIADSLEGDNLNFYRAILAGGFKWPGSDKIKGGPVQHHQSSTR